MNLWELFWRFALISLLAFGGGAGPPLIERIAVRETGWIGLRDFTTAMGLAQIAPGPVMVVATFIGYRAAGLAGALAATVGVFLFPWALAAAMARNLERWQRHKWLRGFRRGAAAAAVGLFGVTALVLARHTLAGWAHVSIAATALILAVCTRIHPVWILLGGALLGVVIGTPPVAARAG
jgi:chromate transporter